MRESLSPTGVCDVRVSSRWSWVKSSPGLLRTSSMLGLLRTSSVRSTGVSRADLWGVRMVTGVFERGVMVPRAWSAASASGFVSGMRAGVGIPWALAMTSNSCGADTENLCTHVCTVHVCMHCTCMHCTCMHCTCMHCTCMHCTCMHCTCMHCTCMHCTCMHCTCMYCTCMYCTCICMIEICIHVCMNET